MLKLFATNAALECRHAITPFFFLVLILVKAPARLKRAKNDTEIFV